MIEVLALFLFLGGWLLFYRNKMHRRSNMKLGLAMVVVSIVYGILALGWATYHQSQDIATGAVIFASGLLGSGIIMMVSDSITTLVNKKGKKYF